MSQANTGDALELVPSNEPLMKHFTLVTATLSTALIWICAVPETVLAAAGWFMGSNDAGELMWDPETGGGFDGLHADGVNRNQGAESTLAVLSTLQHARRFSTVLQ